MGDPLAVTPVETNYPIVVTVCLSLFGTTVLTWCLGEILHLDSELTFSGESQVNRIMALFVLFSLAYISPHSLVLTIIQSLCWFTSIRTFLLRPQAFFKLVLVSHQFLLPASLHPLD